MNVLYSENPVMFKNNPLGFIASVILIAAFGLGIIILLVWYLKTKSLKLTVTEHDIVLEKGLLSKEHSEINIDSIRTIRVSQSFFNRIFGVGKIEIFTAGDNPEVVATGMPEPNRVRELVKRGSTEK
ncbi:MAG: PH domain-containing protein [Proteobacteria bacterium]|nr:PH domain-containing protein [Pseudomonadota bacterium]